MKIEQLRADVEAKWKRGSRLDETEKAFLNAYLRQRELNGRADGDHSAELRKLATQEAELAAQLGVEVV